jgi:acyl carrier protein
MGGEKEDIRTGVRRFILNNFLVGEPPESLRDSTLLMTTGVVSSLAALEMVAFLENEYSVTLREDDLTLDRLDSVDRIVKLVEERQQSAGTPGRDGAGS